MSDESDPYDRDDECPVCAGTMLTSKLAKLGPRDEYGCSACNTVWDADTGEPIAVVNPEWRMSTDDIRDLTPEMVSNIAP